MAIIVNSPFSGQPVKVRDQDAGRAVKDEEGRLFYVLPKSDGQGYYGSMTRAPNTKDEARAREMEDKLAVQRGAVHEQVESARGGGGSWKGKLVILVLLLVVLVGAYLLYRALQGRLPGTTTPQPNPIPAGAADAGAPTRFADDERSRLVRTLSLRQELTYATAPGRPALVYRRAA